MTIPGGFTAGDVLTAADMNLLPAGEVGSASITSSTTFTTLQDISGLSVTFTALASRRYRVTAHGLLRSTVTTDIAQLLIADASSTTISVGQVACVSTTFAVSCSVMAIVTPSAGSCTYKVRGVRSSGSGTITLDCASTYPAYIVVEDIGPA